MQNNAYSPPPPLLAAVYETTQEIRTLFPSSLRVGSVSNRTSISMSAICSARRRRFKEPHRRMYKDTKGKLLDHLLEQGSMFVRLAADSSTQVIPQSPTPSCIHSVEEAYSDQEEADKMREAGDK